MPVQFVCSQCHRRLSVAHRKIGATVACPKCGQPNIVPAGAQAATAPPSEPVPAKSDSPSTSGETSNAGQPPQKASMPAEAAAFDDVLLLIADEEALTSQAVAAGAAPSHSGPTVVNVAAASSVPPPIPPLPAFEAPVPSTASRQPARHRAPPKDGQVLVLTRQAVYAQAGLIGGLVLLSFLAGFAIGRAGRATGQGGAEEASAAGEPVALDGHILFSLSPGLSSPDAGATVIALPEGKTAEPRIAAPGLQPGNEDEFAFSTVADELRAFGGAVARTDRTGGFQLVVPRPGKYSIVILSHRAEQPGDAALSRADQQTLGRVFASPAELVGQKRHAIVSRRLAGAPSALMHEFEPIDKE